MPSYRALLSLLVCLFIVGCGVKETDEPQAALPVVQSADGSLYSIPCLRQIAPSMESQGTGAMESCKVGLGNDLNARGTYSSCSSGSCGNNYGGCSSGSCGSNYGGCSSGSCGSTYTYTSAYVYYPPTYYSYSYYDPYYSNQSYNPYKNYQYTTPFCGYVFGTTYSNWNCYQILGYGNQSYTNYYQSSCSPCSYSYGSGYYCPSQTTNSCWNTRYY